VLPGGFWYEGAPAYHYYALKAIQWAAEAAHQAGISVYEDETHKSLYVGPIEYVFPDLRFPAVNDSNVFSLTGQHAMYELAYARFMDPRLLPVASHGKRGSLQALLWGADELPPTPKLVLESKDFKGLGAAVLRQRTGKEQIYVHLDYGPHGGGHGHADKLTIILFALNRQLAPDPSRLAYAAPLHGSWYRQTFAHNTVCVDQKSQRAAEGRLTLFDSQPGLAVARAECDTAYPGVMMKRTIAVTDRYVIDVFDVVAREDHTYDWTYHNFGTLVPGVEAQPRAEPLGDGHGYQHMRDITQAESDDAWHVDFKQKDGNVRLTMLGAPDTSLCFGTGMSENPPQPCPMVAVRRKAKRTTFISVIEPYKDAPTVTAFERVPIVGDEAALGLVIQCGEDRDVLMVAEKGGRERTVEGVKSTGRACLVSIRRGKPGMALHAQ